MDNIVGLKKESLNKIDDLKSKLPSLGKVSEQVDKQPVTNKISKSESDGDAKSGLLNKEESSDQNISNISEPESEQESENEEVSSSEEHDIKSKLTDVEKKAVKLGWLPKEHFRGDQENWRPAAEYMDRKDLIDTIKELKQEIKRNKKVNSYIAQNFQTQQTFSRKQELDKLLSDRNEAILSGDVNKVNEIHKQIDEVKENYKKIPIPVETAISDPDVADFIEENESWFNDNTPENSIMKDYAIKHEEYLARVYPKMSVKARLTETKRKVEQFFNKTQTNEIESLHTQNRLVKSPRNAVITDTAANKKTKQKQTFDDLPPQAKSIYKELLKCVKEKDRNKMSAQRYAEQYFLMNKNNEG